MEILDTSNHKDVTKMIKAGYKYITRRGYPRFDGEKNLVISRHKTYSAAEKACGQNNAIDDLQYIYDEYIYRNK